MDLSPRIESMTTQNSETKRRTQNTEAIQHTVPLLATTDQNNSIAAVAQDQRTEANKHEEQNLLTQKEPGENALESLKLDELCESQNLSKNFFKLIYILLLSDQIPFSFLSGLIKKNTITQTKIKSSLHSRCYTEACNEWRVHLCVLASGQLSSEKTSQRRRAVGDTMCPALKLNP